LLVCSYYLFDVGLDFLWKLIENCCKTKKTCESLDLQVLPRFLRVFEKIEKVAFLLLLPFLWGEQDSNLRSFHSRFTVCPRWPLEYLPIS
jgi:hypothetical protein